MTTGAQAEQRSGAVPFDFETPGESAVSQALKSNTRVNRRTVAKSACKLAYAAPLVVATLKLGIDDASAQVISPVRP